MLNFLAGLLRGLADRMDGGYWPRWRAEFHQAQLAWRTHQEDERSSSWAPVHEANRRMLAEARAAARPATSPSAGIPGASPRA